MRVFVAVNLPAAERERLHASLAVLRERALPVRWLESDMLHLTLRFIGDIDGSEVAPLTSALRSVGSDHGPFPLDMGGFGAFPSLRRANVLWVGIAAEPVLTALHGDVDLALSRLGYAREQQAFRPHITVARLRRGSRPPDVARIASGHEYEGRFEVATIDLMRSHTHPGGARYDTLLRAPLGRLPPA